MHEYGRPHNGISETVPSLLANQTVIHDILRVANEIQDEDPNAFRILCEHVHSLAQNLDPESKGTGVSQFKDNLISVIKVTKEEGISICLRQDIACLGEFYKLYREKRKVVKLWEAEMKLRELGNSIPNLREMESIRVKRKRASLTLKILASVLEQLLTSEDSYEDTESLMQEELKCMMESDAAMTKDLVNYNLINIESRSIENDFLSFPEVLAAASAFKYSTGLPKLPGNFFVPPTRNVDMFDFLQYVFAFQKDNVSNQREHIIHLLANEHRRLYTTEDPELILNEAAVHKIFEESLGNYFSWCHYLSILPGFADVELLTNEKKLLFLSLHFLIWGEASNIRFLPECLCYIFHHLSRELIEILRIGTAEQANSCVSSDGASFLDNIIHPLYEVIVTEAVSTTEGATHSARRNYDDFNEYFWSLHCFELGWPWRKSSSFFLKPKRSLTCGRTIWSKKTYFVEHQTILHFYHTFSCLWIFLFMMFQGLSIIAFNGGRLDSKTVREVMSVGLTYILMSFLKSVLDIGMKYGAYSSSRALSIARLFFRCFWFSMASIFFCPLYLKALDEKSNPNVKSILFIIYVIFLSIYVAVQIVLKILMQSHYQSPYLVFRFVMWMNQDEPYYVGQRKDIKAYEFVKYMVFWLFVLGCKFSFSYFLQIKPLVKPTRSILHEPVMEYPWHELMSKNFHKALMLASMWLPVTFMYLLDIHIFYTIISAVWGFLASIHHQGKVKSLNAIHKLFERSPDAFTKSLLAPIANSTNFHSLVQVREKNKAHAAQFAPFWNEIIKNLREEDYISNLEMELLCMPTNSGSLPLVEWPLFLLSGKVFLAINIAKDTSNSQKKIWNKISSDCYMKYAVEECYYTIKLIFAALLEDEEMMLVESIYEEIQGSIVRGGMHSDFQLNVLSILIQKVAILMGILKEDYTPELGSSAVIAVQEIFDVIQHDFLSINLRNHNETWNSLSREGHHGFQQLKWPRDSELRAHVRRLHLLLSIKDTAASIPKNLEARHRLEFFINSLFLEMPSAKPVHEMLSLSVFIPHSSEVVLYSMSELLKKNEDGVSILFYLQKKYSDEWKNFLVRRGHDHNMLELQLEDNSHEILEVRFWASYRGHTVARTVRGMMYYRKALMLQAYQESLTSRDVEAATSRTEVTDVQGFCFSPEARALADLKCVYVITSQMYGKQKLERKPEAEDIELLMERNEALRVAFIDEVEKMKEGIVRKEFYSKLVKADINGKAKEIYSIKLPGNPTVGEERAENENHAIIFTRGSAVQKINVNQDNYLEEALKVRNLLEEFYSSNGTCRPTILGVKEHAFSGSASSLASFVANRETGFVILGQCTLAKLFKVRMHYGQSDVMDRIYHITRGGISKASRLINMSGDIFAGFNSILRGGSISYHEYIQVGRGQNLGLNQIAQYEGRIAGGNGGQVLSRDLYRLGRFFDFFRMVSLYSTTVGYYLSNMLAVLTLYIILYGKAYWALSGVDELLPVTAELVQNTALSAVLSIQLLYEIGVFALVPGAMAFILERGILRGVASLITMQFQLSAVFFAFLLGTQTHYFSWTILYGGARNQATDNAFVVYHIKFAENYRLYSRSHFVRGMEIVLLLVVYLIYGYREDGAIFHVLLTLGSWIMAISWLYAPFVFNPCGFQWHKTIEDFQDWINWLLCRGSVGVGREESWETWWTEELAHIQTFGSRVVETVLNLRFFIFQYGIVYKLGKHWKGTSIMAQGLSWIVLALLIILFKVVSFSKKMLVNYQLMVRLIPAIFLLLAMTGLAVAIIFAKVPVSDAFAYILAFLPTGWGILCIATAWKPLMMKLGLWNSIRSIARLYDALMGMLIFIPIALFSCIPFISRIQNRLIFNQAFDGRLETSVIIAGDHQQ